MEGMWVEKYRPAEIAEVAGQVEVLKSLGALLKNPAEMPHLMFSGSAGVGKTTTALCIARQVLGDHTRDNLLELNASDERGIGMVREKVKTFSKYAAFADVPFKLIILDEADEMTADAQTALRRIIEDASRICRFIMIANNISKIIAPLQSRCAVFKFGPLKQEDVILQLKKIAKAEKVTADAAALSVICEYSGGDMRHSINMLQAAASLGKVTEDNIKASAGLAKSGDAGEVLALALAGKTGKAREKMIELTKVYGMSESDFVKYLGAAAFGAENADAILRIIAEYDYRVLSGANPEIQLSAMIAELGAIPK